MPALDCPLSASASVREAKLLPPLTVSQAASSTFDGVELGLTQFEDSASAKSTTRSMLLQGVALVGVLVVSVGVVYAGFEVMHQNASSPSGVLLSHASKNTSATGSERVASDGSGLAKLDQAPYIPRQATLTDVLMEKYCGDLSTYPYYRSANAKGCHKAYTFDVRYALANKMFKRCGATCLYDAVFPTQTAYTWSNDGKCWERKTAALWDKQSKEYHSGHYKCHWGSWLYDKNPVVQRHSQLMHIPRQERLTDVLMERYCGGSFTSPYRGARARGCGAAYTFDVRYALANKMFKDCSNFCLYDAVSPTHTAYKWKVEWKCWVRQTDKEDECLARKSAVEAAVQRYNQLSQGV